MFHHFRELKVSQIRKPGIDFVVNFLFGQIKNSRINTRIWQQNHKHSEKSQNKNNKKTTRQLGIQNTFVLLHDIIQGLDFLNFPFLYMLTTRWSPCLLQSLSKLYAFNLSNGLPFTSTCNNGIELTQVFSHSLKSAYQKYNYTILATQTENLDNMR